MRLGRQPSFECHEASTARPPPPTETAMREGLIFPRIPPTLTAPLHGFLASIFRLLRAQLYLVVLPVARDVT